jgi:hypothetical protein
VRPAAASGFEEGVIGFFTVTAVGKSVPTMPRAIQHEPTKTGKCGGEMARDLIQGSTS